ncbi:ABC transporter ATP-binding protein [Thermodesulfovibrionales bacterium]|nr:ABC transporter ATP-binding protein [Thermodesulfovibrionales bacterium]
MDSARKRERGQMKEFIKAISLKKTFYTPAGEIKILNGIDITFNEGEMVSICGVSGVGKSTFLHTIGALDKPTSGKVIYKIQDTKYRAKNGGEGVNPFSLGDRELAVFRNKTIGFIFQFHYLLPEFSAIENVMMPGLISGRKEAKAGQKDLYERAGKFLDEMGIYARRDHKPGELSGGEQQRVAVARALVLEPKVVLADEPTGNLDAATGNNLFDLLMDINQRRGITFIIVTHNESLSRRCHRALEMIEGRLVNRL